MKCSQLSASRLVQWTFRHTPAKMTPWKQTRGRQRRRERGALTLYKRSRLRRHSDFDYVTILFQVNDKF